MLQQALSAERDEPLYSSNEQHGRNHNGAQPAERRAPGRAGRSLPHPQQRRRSHLSEQTAGHVRALPTAQVYQERDGVGLAEKGDVRRGKLPGDGGEAGGGAGERGRGRGNLGPGEPVPLSPPWTVRRALQADRAGRPPHQSLQERDWRRQSAKIGLDLNFCSEFFCL